MTKEDADKLISNVNRGWNTPRLTNVSAKAENGAEGKKRAKSKYNNRKTEVNGIKFDSQKEANRYQDLKIQEFAGEITDLKLQTKFPIVVNGVKICTYKSDFTYTKKDGTGVTEDVKGMRTAIYRLKKKLLNALYDIEILET